MIANCLRLQRLPLWIECLVLLFTARCLALDSWTNSRSGFWKDGTNWSSGQAPTSASGAIYITNANTKVVTINAQTPSANLTLGSLTLSGPANTTNTLVLADAGTNNPLTLVNSELRITQGGALSVTNSSLVLTGSFSRGFNLFAGSTTLQSGSIRILEDADVTNVTVVIRVGRTNTANLTINSGVLQAGSLSLGDPLSPQSIAAGTVRITGGLLSLSGELSIGDSSPGTGLVEVIGGQLRVANNQTNITRVGNDGVGQMIVSNATALLGDTSVARHDGSAGILIVQTNGLVQFSDDLSIGRFSGATGVVFVADGQLVVVDHSIWVGREGIGQLIVSNGLVRTLSLNIAAVPTNTASGTVSILGGTTIVSSSLIIGSGSGSVAQMLVTGGEIDVTNASGSAAVQIISGTLTHSGGTLTADNLLVTNSTGQLLFNGGKLRTKGSVVSNGMAFVVGDGHSAATLELLGGKHAFANGLVISSNAMLTGCGTIIASITNHGTIATNCAAGPTPPVLTNVSLNNGTNFSFSFGSVAGLTYTIEYKNNLNDASWTLFRTQTGDGTVFNVSDNVAASVSRFFRVRVE